jgi:hypothetical protein
MIYSRRCVVQEAKPLSERPYRSASACRNLGNQVSARRRRPLFECLRAKRQNGIDLDQWLRPSCSPKTKHGGSRRISPSCRSCCGSSRARRARLGGRPTASMPAYFADIAAKGFLRCGLDARGRHELEDLGSCAVLARLAVLNIMRHPHPHRNSCSPKPGTGLGRSRTARAVQPSV